MRATSKKSEHRPAAGEISLPEFKHVTSPSLPDGETSLSGDEQRLMIAEDAYCRAERRGFAPGHEVEDWLAAEQEIERRLPSMPHPVLDAFR